MKGLLKRDDDYLIRSKHLKSLTEEELKTKFWELSEEIVSPMLELAKTHTSPSIERSVLLRMGFSSLEAQPLVNGVIDRGLIGHGVGNVVYRVSNEMKISIRQAGLDLIEGKHWDEAVSMFKGGRK